MKYPASKITAAAHVVHNNYSEVPMHEADVGELVWAEGTVRAMIEKLGDPDELVDTRKRNTELRRLNLEAGESLHRIWERVVGSEKPQSSITVGMADRILSSLEDAPRPAIEITDELVNNVALAAFGPSVVYDRERFRSALADALQTR